MTTIDLKQLLEAGVHFGHQARRWNPKMKQFIYTERDGIHVIDLTKTADKLQEALDFIKNTAAEGGEVIFVGTKRQAKEIVKEEATRAGAMFIANRWVGGLLTNFDNVSKNIKRLNELREKRAKNELADLTKKERLLLDREIAKMEESFGGVDRMTRLPEALFIIDSKKEVNAVTEANKSSVAVVALTDTNSDPTVVTYPIPSNDDAIKAIQLMAKLAADSYLEGKELYNKKRAKEALKEEANG